MVYGGEHDGIQYFQIPVLFCCSVPEDFMVKKEYAGRV